jgi:hypothetical protein
MAADVTVDRHPYRRLSGGARSNSRFDRSRKASLHGCINRRVAARSTGALDGLSLVASLGIILLDEIRADWEAY